MDRKKKAHEVPTDQSHATHCSNSTIKFPPVSQSGSWRCWSVTERVKAFLFLISWLSHESASLFSIT